MNGQKFIVEIKADPMRLVPKIPIIAVTATFDKAQRRPDEFQRVLKKTIEYSELYAIIKKVLVK